MTDPVERMDPWEEALSCYKDFADEVIIVGEKFLNKVDNLSKSLTNNENTTSNYSNWDNKLILRFLSKDSYNLKFAIDKTLSYFFEGSKIPKIWNI